MSSQRNDVYPLAVKYTLNVSSRHALDVHNHKNQFIRTSLAAYLYDS